MVYSNDPNDTYPGSSQAFRDKVQGLLSLHQMQLERANKDLEKLEENYQEEVKALRAKNDELQAAIAAIEKKVYTISILGAIALVLIQVILPAYVQPPAKPYPYPSYQNGYPPKEPSK